MYKRNRHFNHIRLLYLLFWCRRIDFVTQWPFAGLSGTQWICDFQSRPLWKFIVPLPWRPRTLEWEPTRGWTVSACALHGLARTLQVPGTRLVRREWDEWPWQLLELSDLSTQTHGTRGCWLYSSFTSLFEGLEKVWDAKSRGPWGRGSDFHGEESLPLFGRVARVYRDSGLSSVGWTSRAGVQAGGSSALATCGTRMPEPPLCPVPSPAAFAVPCWVMYRMAPFGGLLHSVCSLWPGPLLLHLDENLYGIALFLETIFFPLFKFSWWQARNWAPWM